ncbi:uncharacterized protein LOC100367355 [Saccoglossus kowalevskii]|uniref:Uncharacterized protein LOC100367355 n=1 Tax=Saccoglossus kowalevskii TaxID=10224 RepID=A0ABM0GMV1_SACKO|nr:PREDICTED: uncharacterized protein LOC100367355 [Saccoglossus kowalevskii]
MADIFQVQGWILDYACKYRNDRVISLFSKHIPHTFSDFSVPQVRLLAAVAWSIISREDVNYFDKLIGHLQHIYDTVPEISTFRHFTKMIIGLKMKVMVHLIDDGTCSDAIIIARLNDYFPKAGIKQKKKSSANTKTEFVKLNTQQQSFRLFIVELLANRRKQFYVKRDLNEEYGSEFMQSLKLLVRHFLDKMESFLPQTAIDQFLSKDPDSSIAAERPLSPTSAVDKLVKLLDSGPPGEESLMKLLCQLIKEKNKDSSESQLCYEVSSNSDEDNDESDTGKGRHRKDLKTTGNDFESTTDGNSENVFKVSQKVCKDQQTDASLKQSPALPRDSENVEYSSPLARQKNRMIRTRSIEVSESRVLRNGNVINVDLFDTVVSKKEGHCINLSSVIPTANAEEINENGKLIIDLTLPETTSTKVVESEHHATNYPLESDISQESLCPDILITDDNSLSFVSGKDADVESLADDDDDVVSPRKKRKRLSDNDRCQRRKIRKVSFHDENVYYDATPSSDCESNTNAEPGLVRAKKCKHFNIDSRCTRSCTSSSKEEHEEHECDFYSQNKICPMQSLLLDPSSRTGAVLDTENKSMDTSTSIAQDDSQIIFNVEDEISFRFSPAKENSSTQQDMKSTEQPSVVEMQKQQKNIDEGENINIEVKKGNARIVDLIDGDNADSDFKSLPFTRTKRSIFMRSRSLDDWGNKDQSAARRLITLHGTPTREQLNVNKFPVVSLEKLPPKFEHSGCFNFCTLPGGNERYLSDSDNPQPQYSQDYCESKLDWLSSKARMQKRNAAGQFVKSDLCPVRHRMRYSLVRKELHFPTSPRRGHRFFKRAAEYNDVGSSSHISNQDSNKHPKMSGDSIENICSQSAVKIPSPQLALTAESCQEDFATEPDLPIAALSRYPKGIQRALSSPCLMSSSCLSPKALFGARSPTSPKFLKSPKSPKSPSLLFDFYRKKSLESASKNPYSPTFNNSLKPMVSHFNESEKMNAASLNTPILQSPKRPSLSVAPPVSVLTDSPTSIKSVSASSLCSNSSLKNVSSEPCNRKYQQVSFMNKLRLTALSVKASKKLKVIRQKSATKRPMRTSTLKQRELQALKSMKLVPKLILSPLPQEAIKGSVPVKSGHNIHVSQMLHHNKRVVSKPNNTSLNQSSLLMVDKSSLEESGNSYNSLSYRNNELPSHTSSSSTQENFLRSLSSTLDKNTILVDNSNKHSPLTSSLRKSPLPSSALLPDSPCLDDDIVQLNSCVASELTIDCINDMTNDYSFVIADSARTLSPQLSVKTFALSPVGYNTCNRKYKSLTSMQESLQHEVIKPCLVKLVKLTTGDIKRLQNQPRSKAFKKSKESKLLEILSS